MTICKSILSLSRAVKYFLLLSPIILTPLKVLSSPSTRTCLLNFTRTDGFESSEIKKTLQGRLHKNFKYVSEAMPIDFLDCVNGEFEEIIVVAHGGLMDTAGVGFNLRFEVTLAPIARAKILLEERNKLLRQLNSIKQLDRKAGKPKNFKKFGSKYFNNNYSARIRVIKSQLGIIDNWPEDANIYGRPESFHNIIFKRAFQSVKAKQALGNRVHLRKIVFYNCHKNRLLNRYPGIAKLRDEAGIDVETPKILNSIIFLGYQAAVTDLDHLNESLQDLNNENDEEVFIYMNFNTLGIYGWGESKVLKSQYNVKLNALSFGLSSHKTKIRINKSEIAAMEIGEKIVLYPIRLNFTLGILADYEFDFINLTNQPPSGKEGYGLGIETLTRLEIERLY